MDIQQNKQGENAQENAKGPVFFDEEGFREEAFSDEGPKGRVPDHHGHVVVAREKEEQGLVDGMRQWMGRREPVDLEKPVSGLNFMDLMIGKDEKTGDDHGFWSLTGIKGSFFYGQEKMRATLQALAELAEARRLKEGEGRILGVGDDFYEKGEDQGDSSGMSGADFYARAKEKMKSGSDVDITIDPSHQVEGPGERKLLRAPIDGDIIVPNAARLAAEKGPASFEKTVPTDHWVSGPENGTEKTGPDQIAGAAPVSRQIAGPEKQKEAEKTSGEQENTSRNAQDILAEKKASENTASAGKEAANDGPTSELSKDEKKVLSEISSGATSRAAAPGVDGARAVSGDDAQKLSKPSSEDVAQAEGRSRARRGALRAKGRTPGAERPETLGDAVSKGRQDMRVVSVDDSGNVMLEGRAVEVAVKPKKKVTKRQDER